MPRAATRRWRSLGVGAATAALCISASACTGASASPSPTVTAAHGRLLWWDVSMSAGAHAADLAMVSAFEKANPGVHVDVAVMTPDDAHGRFDNAVQSAAPAPDVITVDSSWIPDWSTRGYLARLDDTVAAAGAQAVMPSLQGMQKWDGRIMAAVRSADGLALLYNKRALAKAGLPVPRSWAEVAADRLKLTAEGVQTLYAPATGTGLLPWIYGEGGSLVDAEALDIQVSQPAAVAALAQRLQMQATGVCVDDSALWAAGTPTPANDVITSAMRTAFRQGRVAMILDDAAAVPDLVGGGAFSAPSQIGVATVPSGSVRSSGPVTATAYGVFSGSHNLGTAFRFVQYAQSPAVQATFAVQLGLLPSLVAAYADTRVAADPVLSGFESVLREGTPLPQVPQQSSLLAPLDDHFRGALTGDESAQSALDAVALSYEKSLNVGFTIGPG